MSYLNFKFSKISSFWEISLNTPPPLRTLATRSFTIMTQHVDIPYRFRCLFTELPQPGNNEMIIRSANRSGQVCNHKIFSGGPAGDNISTTYWNINKLLVHQKAFCKQHLRSVKRSGSLLVIASQLHSTFFV